MCNSAVPTTRRALSALSILLVLGTVARADPIQETLNYSTSMTITDIGVTGTPVVGFQGVSGGSVTTTATNPFGTILGPYPNGVGSAMPLGTFTFSPPPGQSPTVYTDTPFFLTVTVNSVNGDPSAAVPKSFLIEGFLYGTVSSSQTPLTTMSASFSRDSPPDGLYPRGVFGSFSSGGVDTILYVPSGGGSVFLHGGIPNGDFDILGVALGELEVPEPASLLLFAFLGLGLIGRRWWGRGRVAKPEDGQVEGVAGR